jgi:hypothetical protein
MNNAATMDGGGTFGNNLGKWRNLLEINLYASVPAFSFESQVTR